MPTDPKRILVVHHLLLGDTLMLTPLLAKLRQQYPSAEIIMTAPKASAPLYATRPYGVTVIAYDPRDIATLKTLRNYRGFDLAIVPGDNRFSWLALALGAKWIIAFADDIPKYKNWPVDQLIPYPSVPAAWGDMVAGLIPGSSPQSYQAKQWAQPPHEPFTLPQSPYCVLHLGASSKLKLWENEKWLALVAQLEKLGYQIVWSVGKNEKHLVEAIDTQHRYKSYAGTLDLPQLWQLLKNAVLLVCPDTGVAHLGRIVDVPTVTLFGPGSALICGTGEFWRNSTYRPVTVENFPCRDQTILFRRQLPWVQRCGRSTDECSRPLCMEAIDVASVVQIIDSLLAEKQENFLR